MGEPIHLFTVILYPLCIGNFLSPPMLWLHALYERPAPYDWLIFLVLLCLVMLRSSQVTYNIRHRRCSHDPAVRHVRLPGNRTGNSK